MSMDAHPFRWVGLFDRRGQRRNPALALGLFDARQSHPTMLVHFLLQLIAGISLTWAVMPRAQVTSGFFRIQHLLVLGLSVLTALAANRMGATLPTWGVLTAQICAGLAAGVAFVGSVLWTLERRRAGTVSVYLICGLIFGPLIALAAVRTTPVWLGILSELSSGATVGGAVTAMLLGHWYLTAPTMSIAPLRQLTLVLLIAVGVRLVVSAIAFGLGGEALHGSLVWTWFALRWLAGIVAPLVLCGMTLRILRYRNTQAATGVLFAIVILAFIGELAALLLSSELQRPW